MAHSVAVLRRGLLLDYRLVAGQCDFRMAASSGIVFAEALLGRDGRVSEQPGGHYALPSVIDRSEYVRAA